MTAQAVFRNWENDADTRLDSASPDVFGADGRTWYRVSVPFDGAHNAEDLIDAATEAELDMLRPENRAEAASIRRAARQFHNAPFI